MEELKPCPFCGHPAVLCKHDNSPQITYSVMCKNWCYCGCHIGFEWDYNKKTHKFEDTGIYYSKDRAIKAWNTREHL